MEIVGYILFSIASFFCWILIHEFSHLLFASFSRKIISWKIYPYPHVHNKTWYWARIEWTYEPPEITKWEIFVMKLSPRIANIISGILFCLSFLFDGPFFILWIIFWGFGLIDFIVGSIGYSPLSDLREAAKAIGWNPWILRISGFILILIFALGGTLLFALI